MATVAVDIDSTLYDFETAFRQAFLEIAMEEGDKGLFRGAYASWVEWRSPWDVCGSDAFYKALAKVHSREVIATRKPFEGAVDVIWDLAKQHDLIYISNREEKCFWPTESWLRCQGFAKGEVICTQEDKMDFVSECQYIIDDRPKTLCNFVYEPSWHPSQESGERKGFGLLFEYNRALTDIPNVFLAPTWEGLRYYLEREGVLDGSTDSLSLSR